MFDRVGKPAPLRAKSVLTVTKRLSDPGDVTYLIAVARRWRRLIVVSALLGLLAGGLYLLVATPQYRATARILIDFRRLADIGQDQLAINNKVNDSAVDSQATIMTSEGVVRAVVQSLRLDQDSELVEAGSLLLRVAGMVGWEADAPATDEDRMRTAIDSLLRRLRANRVGISYVIELQFHSRDEAKAARIANAVADAYVDDQLSSKQEAAGSANDWYRNRILELQEQASASEKAAVGFRAKNEIMLVDGRFIDEQQLSDVSRRLITSRTERAQAQAKLDQIDAILRNNGEGAVADEFKNNVITALRQKLGELSRRLIDNTERYGPEHDTVQRTKSEIREIRNSIAEEFRRIAAGYRSDAAVAQLNEEATIRSLENLSGRSAQAQSVRIELAQLQSVADTYKTMRGGFLSRYAEAAQEQSFPITEARIVSRAAQPTRPISPDPFKILVGGMMGALGLGCATALARDVLSRRVRDRKQLEAALGGPCLAVIGDLPALARKSGSTVRDDQSDFALEYAVRTPYSAFAEALRAIKIQMDAWRPATGESHGLVLAFVSAVPDEGVTTIAANFAGLLAQGGNPTLLIDLDLRQRNLSRMTQENLGASEDGIQQVLAGTANIRQVIRRRGASGLHVLPASNKSKAMHPADLMLSPALRTFLELARDGYHYIILDLPPMIPVADARAVAGVVDRYVVVTQWNATTLDDLQNAVVLNPAIAEKLLGAVLNRADPATLDTSDDTLLSRSISYLDETAGMRSHA